MDRPGSNPLLSLHCGLDAGKRTLVGLRLWACVQTLSVAAVIVYAKGTKPCVEPEALSLIRFPRRTPGLPGDLRLKTEGLGQQSGIRTACLQPRRLCSAAWTLDTLELGNGQGDRICQVKEPHLVGSGSEVGVMPSGPAD